MNYNQAIQYLYNLTSLGWKLGLNKVRSLLNELNNPHKKYKTIHIAGTNGKGSTSAMLESILRSAGYKTGLFTSPHLVYIGERIKCNGKSINQEELVYYIEHLQPLIKKYRCTFFETITAIAFVYFADQQIDIAVIEVGLGGRLDATNVITPLISIITNIEIDHTKQLGTNRKSIAFEKAGIIKPETICITNCRYDNVESIFDQICQERQVEHIRVDQLLKIKNVQLGEKITSLDMAINGSIFPHLKLPLIGEHQIQNAALAVTTANVLNSRFLPIKIKDIYHGLLDVQWPGRLHIISDSPKVVVDVGHNPNGISYLSKSIRTIFNYDRLIVLLGVCKDKNYTAMVKKLAPISNLFIAVKANINRALSPTTLANVALKFTDHVHNCNTTIEGLSYALNHVQKGDLILCTGSHYIVSEILNHTSKKTFQFFL
ncbi:MAG: bifunctional folylpolyglutamate synthase/dihydrofolate synthase [bacterium]|nr:MAG: bifunctional folylpolyglutamate synthase/dihydrofolate synthase [bacterium]